MDADFAGSVAADHDSLAGSGLPPESGFLTRRSLISVHLRPSAVDKTILSHSSRAFLKFRMRPTDNPVIRR
jgi:hypothetical protein